MAKEHQVASELDIVFAEHDGMKLLGDLYLPKGLDKTPGRPCQDNRMAREGGASRLTR
jgi:hypothetical protein